VSAPNSIVGYHQDEHDDTAKAKKVLLVDASGSSVALLKPVDYSFLGSDCTGSNGDSNRVLTLANTAKIYNLHAHVNGVRLHESAFTLTNPAGGSATIEFLFAVWDADQLTGDYYQ